MDDDVVAYMGWNIPAQEHLDNFRNEIRELKKENEQLQSMVNNVLPPGFWTADGTWHVDLFKCPTLIAVRVMGDQTIRYFEGDKHEQ